MGGIPWEYFVPHEPDIRSALAKLQQRELIAGRFRGAELLPATKEKAVANSGESGTASILDMEGVSLGRTFLFVSPLDDSDLIRFFGTTRPTRKEITDHPECFEELDRGEGIYVVVYNDNEPSEIYFGGYSVD